MRFSIVVPVYNVEKYIARCMESLVNQSFQDYEIIVVDDESPDGSMDIVERYREKEPEKIRVIHQKNTRQGGARNHGVELALGEYLLFVDSDDYVSRSMLEIVDRRLKETPCDILAFDCTHVDAQGDPIGEEICDTLKPGLYDPLKNREVVNIRATPWGKAYKREFYVGSGFRFPEKLLYEDGMSRILFAKASRIRVTEDSLYYYVHRENSSMTQKISEKMLDIVTVAELIRQEFKKAKLYEDFKDPLEVGLIYTLLCIEEIINLQEPDNPMQIQIADYILKTFPDYRSNPCASPEMIRILNCLTAHKFKKYHSRFLLVNRMKERILQNAALRRLNDYRKQH